MQLEIVDVFAEAPLQGNQLAVVHCGDRLSDRQMQDIAREMNFSETTFVLSQAQDRARVRIFTPGQELPFAGHPTIGTAWVLGREQAEFTLDLNVGPVTVSFAEDGRCWMAPPMPEFTGELSVADAAALVGLPPEKVAQGRPRSLMRIGPEFAFIGVTDIKALEAATLDAQQRSRLLSAGLPVSSVFVFCEGEDTSFAARMFFDAGGLREDPATGSANSAFAIYLRDKCALSPGQYDVAQGDFMHRPSRIYLDIETDAYRVGGRVQPVVSGQLSAS